MTALRKLKRVLGFDTDESDECDGEEYDWVYPEDEPPTMKIHFERGHDGHYLRCEDCGERVQIVGEGVAHFDPGGCACKSMDYKFEVVDDDE